jgi:hypothetical protein
MTNLIWMTAKLQSQLRKQRSQRLLMGMSLPWLGEFRMFEMQLPNVLQHWKRTARTGDAR